MTDICLLKMHKMHILICLLKRLFLLKLKLKQPEKQKIVIECCMVNGTSFYFIILTDKKGLALGRLD